MSLVSAAFRSIWRGPVAAWLLAGVFLILALGRALEDGPGSTILNSDALYPHLFARDLLSGVPVRGWRLPPAGALFPDFLLVFPAVAIGRFMNLAPIWTVVISGAAFGLAWTVAYAWLFRVLARDFGSPVSPSGRRLKLAAPLAAAGIFASLAFGHSPDPLEPLFIPGFHAGAALFLPIVLALIRIAIGDGLRAGAAVDPAGPPRRLIFASAIFVAILTLLFASDRFVVVGVLLPALCGCLVLLRRDRLYAMGALVLAALLAFACGEVLLRGLDRVLVITRLGLPFELLLTPEFRAALFEAPAQLEVQAGLVEFLFFASLVLLIAGWFRARALPEPRRRLLRWLIAVHLALVAILFVAMIPVAYMSGRILIVARYFAPAFAFPVFAAAFCWLAIGIRDDRGDLNAEHSRSPGATRGLQRVWRPALWAGGLLCLCGGLLAACGHDSLLRPFRTAQRVLERAHEDPLIACMRRNGERLGRFGLSGYWPAKQISYLSDGEFQINQLQSDLSIMYWINNFEWYRAPHREGGYGFVIANGLDAQRIAAVYGDADERIHCAGLEFLSFRNPALQRAFPPETLDFALKVLGLERD